MYAYIYVYRFGSICMYAYIYVYRHCSICMYVCMYIYVYRYGSIYMYAYIYIYVYRFSSIVLFLKAVQWLSITFTVKVTILNVPLGAVLQIAPFLSRFILQQTYSILSTSHTCTLLILQNRKLPLHTALLSRIPFLPSYAGNPFFLRSNINF